MDPDKRDTLNSIRRLLETERLAVLSTSKNDVPYASLVAFAASDDLKELCFLTPVATRKYKNISANPNTALLVTNSRNTNGDISGAAAVTATGIAATVTGDDRQETLPDLLGRHPDLEAFAAEPDTALVKVKIDRYIWVSRFQNVVKIRMDR